MNTEMLPVLQVGSSVARALMTLIECRPIARLEPSAGSDPLVDLCALLGWLVRQPDVGMNVLMPIESHAQARRISSDMLRIFGEIGVNAQGSSMFPHIHISGPNDSGVTLVLKSIKQPTQWRARGSLLVVSSQLCPAALRPPHQIWAEQVLLVGSPEEPAPMITDKLAAAAHGQHSGFWGDAPLEILLAGVSE